MFPAQIKSRFISISRLSVYNFSVHDDFMMVIKHVCCNFSDARAISTPDPNLPDHIFNWTIPNIDSLDDKGRESPPHKVKGLPWYDFS